MRDQFIATVKELFETDECTFNTTYSLGYNNTVRSNTYQGRKPAMYADVQMLWEVFRAATLAAQAQQPTDSVSNWLWSQLMDYVKSRGMSPTTHDELFKIVDRARQHFDSPAPTKDK